MTGLIKQILILSFSAVIMFSCSMHKKEVLEDNTIYGKTSSKKSPVHIMLAIADHYEPTWDPDLNILEAKKWLTTYAALAKKHHDADGVMPQHTWFSANIENPANHIGLISKAVYNDLGEIEIHIHHSVEETTDTIDKTEEMSRMIDTYLDSHVRYGACLSAEKEPKKRFGFVHGNWALDNSELNDQGHRVHCGVNSELSLLKSKGSYADFSFPYGAGTMSPTIRNQIIISKDDPEPKSYDNPKNIRLARVGDPLPADDEYTLIVGPSRISCNVCGTDPRSLKRMEEWLKDNIHVEGREDWVFIKLYTHSFQAMNEPKGTSAIMKDLANQFFTDIEKKYNDGEKYALHYVTAREMYNIMLAAMAGKSGNPNDYRDFMIPQPVNKRMFCSKKYETITYDIAGGCVEIKILENSKKLRMMFKDFHKGDIIYEKNNPTDKYKLSNAAVLSKKNEALSIKDKSPSKFYRIIKKK